VQLKPWARSPEHLVELAKTYREHNLANHDQMVTVYPGVVDLVHRITAHGLTTGVVTSKNREGTQRGLSLVGLDGAFDVLVCADDVVHAKPHPEPVLKAVAQLGADPATTIFVGDSIHDLHAGRAAGVLTGAVLWGPFSRAELEPAAPDYWFGSVQEMERVVIGSRE
jgi:pyrophosphatase PpaX